MEQIDENKNLKKLLKQLEAINPDENEKIIPNTDSEISTKDNSTSLIIKQIYFDQIISGKKRIEYRELNKSNASKFLVKNKRPKQVKDIKYIKLYVGYHPNRDYAKVEVDHFEFLPNNTLAIHIKRVVEINKKN